MNRAVAALHRRLSPIGNATTLGDGGRADDLAARVRRPFDRRFLARVGRLNETPRAVDAPPPATGAPRVLVLALRGWVEHNACEAALAAALRLRGADVALLTCGGGMPACELGRAREAFPRPCDRCGWYTDEVAARLNLPTYRLRSHLPWGADARRAPRHSPGEDARERAGSTAGWLLRTSRPEDEPDGAEMLDDLGIAAEGVAEATRRIFADFKPDVVVMLNGLFTAEATVRAVAAEAGVRTVTYEFTGRLGALTLSQQGSVSDHAIDQAWERVATAPLRPAQDAAIKNLMRGRVTGRGAHVSYFDGAESDADVLRRGLDLPADRPVVTLFTNLTWDTAVSGKHAAYASMMDWVEHAVRAAGDRPDLALVVRTHPAESRWATRERVATLLTERMGALPSNVRLIGPEDPVSSYALLELSALVSVYTTTVGLEASVSGIPVAVAGEPHYRGRGFTVDLTSPPDLERLLDALPDPLTPDRIEAAWRYAYTWFFRYHVPFPVVGWSSKQVERQPSPAELRPGADPYLDFVCARILDGGEFILPDQLATADPTTVA